MQFTKDGAATLDYRVDWSKYLDTDTLATSTFTVDTGLTKVSDAHTTTTATVWLSGGTAGTTYNVTNHVTTTAGRTDERSFRVVVRDR